MTGLITGSAREVITPPVGIPLGGNARSNNYSTEVLHDLFVRVFYAASGNEAVCIVSVELLGLLEQDARALREQVAAAIGIQPGQVMVSCTHTHSGPDTLRLFCATEEKFQQDAGLVEPWVTVLFQQTILAAQRAQAKAAVSTMALRQVGNSELPHNRRLRLKSGETVMNWTLPDPEAVECALGPVDPAVTLAAFYDADGKLTGVIMHYTLHPAILAGENLAISGDYCGVAMKALEEEFAGEDGAAFLFLNGALGNINHIDFAQPGARDPDEVNRCGASLGACVREMLHSIKPSDKVARPEVVLRSQADELLFPIREISDEQLAHAAEVLSRDQGLEMAAADGVPIEMEAMRTMRLYEVRTTGKSSGEFTTVRDGKVVVPVQVFQVGDLIIAGVPAEMFVEYGLWFRGECQTPYALLTCMTNGYVGYVPTSEALLQGGYESGLGPGYLPASAGDLIMKKLLTMKDEMEATNG